MRELEPIGSLLQGDRPRQFKVCALSSLRPLRVQLLKHAIDAALTKDSILLLVLLAGFQIAVPPSAQAAGLCESNAGR
jgi:hypothetical protein